MADSGGPLSERVDVGPDKVVGHVGLGFDSLIECKSVCVSVVMFSIVSAQGVGGAHGSGVEGCGTDVTA